MVTDIEGMKKIKANITEVNLVAVPKLVSKINSHLSGTGRQLKTALIESNLPKC